MNNYDEAVCALDLDGRITYMNPAAERMLGWTAAETLGREVHGVLHARSLDGQAHPREQCPLLAPLGADEALRHEDGIFVRKDGSPLPVSYVEAPIMTGGHVSGAVLAFHDITRQKRAEAASARLSALQSITDVELAHLSLADLLRETLFRLRDVLPIDAALVLLATPDGESLKVSAALGLGDGLDPNLHIPFSAGPLAQIATSTRPLSIEPLPREAVPQQFFDFVGERFPTLLGARMRIKDRILGVLLLATLEPHQFTHDELQLVRQVAGRTALAVERARLYERERAARAEAERAHARFAFLAEVGGMLSSSLDYDETLDRLAHLVVPQLADWCFIDVIEEDGSLKHLVTAHQDPEKVELLLDLRRRYPPEAITFDPVPMVITTGQSVWASELTDEMWKTLNFGREDEVLATARQLGFRSGICVPLTARERIVGALSMVRGASSRRYDEDDFALAEDLARRAGVAIDNARLYRKAQQALQSAEEIGDELHARATELTAIIQAMPGAVAFCDTHGAITRVNPAAAALFGIPPAELTPPFSLAGAVQNAFSPDGTPLPPEEHPLNQALRGTTSMGYRFMMRRYDTGEEVHLLTTFAPIRDVMGRIIGAVAASDDITQATKLEQQKDEFLSIASHELKTPLTSLRLFVELSYRRLRRAGSPEADHILGMERSLGRMERLVNDLLDVTRINAGRLEMRPEVRDLCLLCRQIVEEQSAASERPIGQDIPDGPLLAEVDPARIGQVLINLLSNALKYSPMSCAITVRLAEIEGRRALICVRDEGVGIPPEVQAGLFQRFYRVPDTQVLNGSEVGLGLGLYISRQIVERHGGEIWVESAIGAGTAFCFTLHLMDEPW
jgi:PAS domain S-box-containing protein